VIDAGGFYEQDSGNVSVVPAYAGRYAGTDPEMASMSPLVDWGFVTQAQEGSKSNCRARCHGVSGLVVAKPVLL
jgi:hypothetical protein